MWQSTKYLRLTVHLLPSQDRRACCKPGHDNSTCTSSKPNSDMEMRLVTVNPLRKPPKFVLHGFSCQWLAGHIQNVSQGVTVRSKWSKITILSSDLNIKPELWSEGRPSQAKRAGSTVEIGWQCEKMLRDGHQSTWPNTATQDFSKTKTVKFYAKPCSSTESLS